MRLIELLFPRKCPFCGKLLEKTEPDLCAECVKSLPWTGTHAKSHGSFYSACVSPLRYTGNARQAILRFKFASHASYGACFGKLMADCVRRELDGTFDVITYVPVSFRRFRKRGYSQAKLLAEALGAELGIPCAPLLKKARHTEAQSHLRGEAARKANVSGAFVTLPGAEIAGKTVLLADDVVTTGATLAECSRILLTAGAEKVYGATLCLAERKPKTGNEREN